MNSKFTRTPNYNMKLEQLRIFPQSINHCYFGVLGKRYSHIGKRPIYLTQEIESNIQHIDNINETFRTTPMITLVTLKGPLGSLSVQIPKGLTVKSTPGTPGDDSLPETMFIHRNDSIYSLLNKYKKKFVNSMWGTTNSLLRRHCIGVTDGHRVIIRLVGVGFRATLNTTAQQQHLILKVGFSHLIQLDVPQGIQVTLQTPTKIILNGIDYHKVTQFASKIRSKRPPEPYNGKGIFVGSETIIRKEGKKK